MWNKQIKLWTVHYFNLDSSSSPTHKAKHGLAPSSVLLEQLRQPEPVSICDFYVWGFHVIVSPPQQEGCRSSWIPPPHQHPMLPGRQCTLGGTLRNLGAQTKPQPDPDPTATSISVSKGTAENFKFSPTKWTVSLLLFTITFLHVLLIFIFIS